MKGILYLIVPLFLLVVGCATRQAPTVYEIKKPDSLLEKPVKVCAPLPTPAHRCDVYPVAESQDFIIAGDIMTPTGIIKNGEIYISAGKIASVGCSSDNKAVTMINCSGELVTPGLVNAHDHLTFNSIPPGGNNVKTSKYEYCNDANNAYSDVDCSAYRYDRRNEWRKGLNNKVKIEANPQQNDPKAALVWNELRHIMAATTTVAGSGGIEGLVRNPDNLNQMERMTEKFNVKYVTFPLGDTNDVSGLTDSCSYPKVVGTEVLNNLVFLPHVAEGIDKYARNEILCLTGRGTNSNSSGVNLLSSNTTFIHALAVTTEDAQLLAAAQTSVVWSPRSNISLYGNTAPVTLFKNTGVNIALGSDWTPSGSINMIRELQCAASYNDKYLGNFFSSKELWEMATLNSAKALGIGDQIGKIADGYLADLAVIHPPKPDDPYASVIASDSNDVVLTVRGGSFLFGDAATINSLLPGRCDAMGEVCGVPKSVCLEGTGYSFKELKLKNEANFTLTMCGSENFQPTCTPSRYAQYNGERSEQDWDGDGVKNALDNCPHIFNPPRPMDDGRQMDVCNSAVTL